MTRRVIFTGSRTYDDRQMVRWVVNGLVCEPDGLTIVHGACPTGTDKFVDEVAQSLVSLNKGLFDGTLAFEIEPHPADWDACDWDHPSVPCPPGREHRKQRRVEGPAQNTFATYCPLAGFRRNAEMAALGADACFAFVDKPLILSKGTNDMVERAARAGIDPIHVITTGGRP